MTTTSDPPQLPQKARDILSFLQWYHSLHGYPPSLREIQQACQISSTSVVAYHLGNLQHQGLISRTRNIARSAQITPGGRTALLAQPP